MPLGNQQKPGNLARAERMLAHAEKPKLIDQNTGDALPEEANGEDGGNADLCPKA